MFELRSDDSLRVIEHVGREPISMEDGAKRMEALRDLFPGTLKRAGYVPPPLMDPERGGVAALGDYYAMAEDEGYTIHYGFTGSFQPERPLLPVFMITLRHKMNEPDLPIRRVPVVPPEGYEHISLEQDERNVGSEAEPVMPKAERETEPIKDTRREQAAKVAEGDPATANKGHRLWVTGGVLLLGVAFILIRAFTRGRAS